MAISGVGVLKIGFATSGTSYTVSVTPATVGNCLLCTTTAASASGLTSTLSGGGVTTWTKIIAAFTGPNGDRLDLWMGTVTTAGAGTLTVTAAATITATCAGVQEFTNGSTSTVWAVDITGTKSNTASTSVTFPTLVPAGSGELYFGASDGSTPATAGPGGYVWQLDHFNDSIVYNASVSTSQSPVVTGTPSGVSGAIAALITATVPAGSTQGLLSLCM